MNDKRTSVLDPDPTGDVGNEEWDASPYPTESYAKLSVSHFPLSH